MRVEEVEKIEEVWADIPEYQDLYMVSNLGNVKRLEHFDQNGHCYTERLLKAAKSSNGYTHVHLSKNGVAKWHSIHRLVAAAFVEKPDGCDIVNHLDNNPQNNNADNLEWTTYKGNMQHAARQGRMKGNPENLKRAQEAHKRAVIAFKDGQEWYFASQAEAGQALGVCRKHIAGACRKEYGYKTVGGYEWQYLDTDYQGSLKPKRTGRTKEEMREFLRERMMGNTLMVGRKLKEETKEKLRHCNTKPVLQFEQDGRYVQRFMSMAEARRITGIGHIDACCRGERKTAGGYIWRYENE